MKEKSKRKSDDVARKIVNKMNLVDDLLFEELIGDGDACEELLQVVLENSKLRIDKSTLVPQKKVSFLVNRSVILDAYVEGCEDKVFNIEMQTANNLNHLKRARYNAACLTVKRSEPGDLFEHVQEVYIVYISKFDMFKSGMAVYHVEPCIRETGEFLDNGLHQVFVNTCCDDGSRIARLMRHFEEADFSDNEFPKISERMHYLKHNKEEVAKMMGKVQEYAEEYAKEYAKEHAREYAEEYIKDIEIQISTKVRIKDAKLSEEEIIDKIMTEYNLTHEEAKSYYDKCITCAL